MDQKYLPDNPKVINVPNFWTRLSNSTNRFLGLDYDGTLAPLRMNRAEAYPLPGMVELLKALSNTEKTFPAIISGRPLSELMPLIGDLDITLVGSHGFELEYPGGEIIVISPSPRQLEGLDAAQRIISALHFGDLIESKATSLALHTRPLPTDQARQVEVLVNQLWSPVATSNDLYCRRFNGGIEIVAKGWSKGHAVLRLINECGTDLPVYLGDDSTDEDVFDVLLGRGIGIRIGEPEALTAAAGFLPNCEAVREFLKSWLAMEWGEEA